jgi:hypothetical protein
MEKKEEIKSILIVGRRWLDKIYGNTYHSSQSFIDGELKDNVNFEYGYDEGYKQTAFESLEKKNLIPERKKYDNGMNESFRDYTERTGIKINYTVSDVSRKKDL